MREEIAFIGWAVTYNFTHSEDGGENWQRFLDPVHAALYISAVHRKHNNAGSALKNTMYVIRKRPKSTPYLGDTLAGKQEAWF